MIDFKDFDDNISDEMLAAYIDGNATESESQMIESSLDGDSSLSEAYEIANDGLSLGSNFDWELHKGDFGFWKMGLPPVVDALDMASQSQDYRELFDNNNELYEPDSYLSSNDLYSDNDKNDYDDSLLFSDLDDINL